MLDSRPFRAAVITFPGSNCDDDLIYTLRKQGFEVDNPFHKDSADLSRYQLVVLPGGFSYGDYLRCGAIASLSPIMQSVKDFAAKGGLVAGICNGFQILCESGLLPGALARNESLKFVCRDVAMKVETCETPWTKMMTKGSKVTYPIAHGDGRYVIDDAGYEALQKNGQIVLRYEDPNPNGSTHAIAGICNEKKNVFGLMPHPERATDLRSGDGLVLWKSLTAFLTEGAR